KPHKKWFENIYVTYLLEVDGSLYRAVCTLSRFSKRVLRKVLICTDSGDIVQSKEVKKKITVIIVYLHYFQIFSNNMEFDSKQDRENNLDKVIAYLNTIYTELYTSLSEDEKAVVNEHLTFYRHNKQLIDSLAILSRKCLKIVDHLENLDVNDILTEDFIEKMHQLIIKRGRLRGDVEASILKNGVETRMSLNNILRKSEYRKQISDKWNLRLVINEIYSTLKIENSIIRKGQKDWPFYEKWLSIDKGKFTINKFIHDLSNLNEAELFIQSNINIITKNHLVDSPNL